MDDRFRTLKRRPSLVPPSADEGRDVIACMAPSLYPCLSVRVRPLLPVFLPSLAILSQTNQPREPAMPLHHCRSRHIE